MTRGQSDSQDLVQYRAVYGSLVDSLEFKQLSADARATFLILRVSPECGPAGIFLFYLEPLMDRTGLPRERVQNSLDELEHAGWIVREQNVLWIRNALRFTPNFNVSNENHRIAILKQVRTLPKLAIVRKFCDYYNLDAIPHGIPHAIPDQEKVEVKEKGRGSVRGKPTKQPEVAQKSGGDIPPPSPPLGVSLFGNPEKPKSTTRDKEREQIRQFLEAEMRHGQGLKPLSEYLKWFPPRYDTEVIAAEYGAVNSAS